MSEFYASAPLQAWPAPWWASSPSQPPVVLGKQPSSFYWKHRDTSLHVASIAFVAGAILISIMLIIAVFERFLRPLLPLATTNRTQDGANNSVPPAPSKRDDVVKEINYSSSLSVLMPGYTYPTFVAHPTPMKAPSRNVVALWNLDRQTSQLGSLANSHLGTKTNSAKDELVTQMNHV